MKINVPEKIYLDKNNITLLDMLSVKDTKRIEYTRTDAFIEKAADYIANNMRCDGYTFQTKAKFIRDFKKCMEE